MSRRITGAIVATAAGLGLVAVAGPAHAASLRVSKTSGLDPAGESVTVTGSGFDPDRNNGFGVYVVFGPRRADFHRNANAFASAVWVHKGGSGGAQAKMSASGTFSVTLTVKARYTDGDGRSVDCASTRCYVMAMAAHGVADRSQDASVPMAFRGTGGPSSSPGRDGGAATGSGGPGGPAGSTGSSGPAGAAGAGAAGGAAGAGAAGGAGGTAAGANPHGGLATTPGGTASPVPRASPAGSAAPLAAEPARVTASGPPARSPWPFWLAVAAVAAAGLAVRRLARRRP
ncbi:hypothetical protein [Actinomadura sp. WMMB 499]|uniref:hypothetical protein n=1 Tax=Actinomadura sp. WMMB 499 TaxID=1219491 RepID=UPI00159D58EF|nr:hypothetical protein [Actinomadura sp. WMMB 499]